MQHLEYGFVTPTNLVELGPKGFVRQIERLLMLGGFKEVMVVDGSNDHGADIVALNNGELWVIQSKWSKNPAATISNDAINDIRRAIPHYKANKGLIVTNATYSKNFISEVTQLSHNLNGVQITQLDGQDLIAAWKRVPNFSGSIDLRSYQEEAFRAIKKDLMSRKTALLILATGLGKTVVAGEVIASHLQEKPSAKVLVLAHTVPLVQQLEKALWLHLPKNVVTTLITSEDRSDIFGSVVCATHQSAIKYIRQGFRPSLIVIDEAHNVGRDSEYDQIISLCKDADVLGVTATPWRLDGFGIEEIFGEPSFRMGIQEGIHNGYLSDVDYRLYFDSVPWEEVLENSKKGYSLSDLNKRLFLPQLDEQIRDHLNEVWQQTVNPRAIVFCSSIEHAERMASTLRAIWPTALAFHSGQSLRDRQMNLLSFKRGESKILTAVDTLNEGVDVPDVNIICFARVTHSRKIFIQQLGRGLRLKKHSNIVSVLDFATDLRRLKAVSDFKSSLINAGPEEIYLGPSKVQYHYDKSDSQFLMRWVEDMANLEAADDSAKLDFPDVY
jgi:superfamily II DNA or RNA helicase